MHRTPIPPVPAPPTSAADEPNGLARGLGVLLAVLALGGLVLMYLRLRGLA